MTIKRKINSILKEYGASWIQVKSQCREWHLVECRKDIIRMLREHDPKRWSYPAIGRLMDRDHTSIMHLASDDFRQRRNKQAIENHRRRRETRLNASTAKLTA